MAGTITFSAKCKLFGIGLVCFGFSALGLVLFVEELRMLGLSSLGLWPKPPWTSFLAASVGQCAS